MDLNRRRFLGLTVAAIAGAVVAGWALLRETAPVRWLRAQRGRNYPGPITRLDLDDVRKPGRWIG
ncbi:MAG: twin-arginine translocation signal domain-containing protein [bacterium]